MAKKNANPPVKSKTNVPVQKTGSPSTIHHPLVHEATIGNRRRWAAWQDWLSVLLGIYLALAYLWIPGAPTALWVTLGVLVTVASLWAGTTASSTLAEFENGTGVLIPLGTLWRACRGTYRDVDFLDGWSRIGHPGRDCVVPKPLRPVSDQSTRISTCIKVQGALAVRRTSGTPRMGTACFMRQNDAYYPL